ncbi:MAG: hypothetical protein Q8P41_16635 [Pseudomonadota bacterium]|nr:hypothetical protein [Pseudomonadota bacterium]
MDPSSSPTRAATPTDVGARARVAPASALGIRGLAAVGLAALLLTGCARAALSPPPPEATVPSTLQPHVAAAFVDGPALADPVALLAWLDGLPPTRLLRLPVTVDFGGDTRLGVARAWIGATGDTPPDGAVLLHLDDSRMGVAVLDHLRSTCPAGPRTCAVWLEGTWAPSALPGVTAPPDDPLRHAFAVQWFVGLAEAGATHVRVAAGG